MINYYYEIKDGITTFGKNQKYLASYDIKPGHNVSEALWRKFHDAAIIHSSRVWLENANGIRLVAEDGKEVLKEVDSSSITWLKLICKDILLR